MSDQANAYPLSWPTGWLRTPSAGRGDAPFGMMKAREGSSYSARLRLTLAEARGRLVSELDRLGARDEILSTNLQLRLDGWPKSGQAAPADPGAAVYFALAGKTTVLACDKWNRVEDNIAAIAKHIEALRGIERWGVGSLEQAFTGYAALAAPTPWWQVLGMPGATCDGNSWSEQDVRAHWRARAAKDHPDKPGGSHDAMAAVNAALDEGLALIRSGARHG